MRFQILTRMFWVVTCFPPILPGIFLPGHTRPGSWDAPVDPGTRWARELPWVADPPLKLCFFITPWNPFPIDGAVTSINWPAIKWEALMGVPMVTKRQEGKDSSQVKDFKVSFQNIDRIKFQKDSPGAGIAALDTLNSAATLFGETPCLIRWPRWQRWIRCIGRLMAPTSHIQDPQDGWNLPRTTWLSCNWFKLKVFQGRKEKGRIKEREKVSV